MNHAANRLRASTEEVIAILGACEKATGISMARLLGQSREAPTVMARWACWLVIRDTMGLARFQISSIFGRDPSTISHGLSNAEGLRASNPQFAALCETLENAL